MSRPRLHTYDVRKLLALHSAVVDELRFRDVVRSRNNPTGDYAEWLVAQKLGLKLVTNSSKGYDATDRRGRKYQIKGRRAPSRHKAPLLGTIRDYEAGHFDFLVAVIFELDWSVRCAVRVAHGDLKDFLQFREHVNGHNMRFGATLLADRRVRDLSDVLRS